MIFYFPFSITMYQTPSLVSLKRLSFKFLTHPEMMIRPYKEPNTDWCLFPCAPSPLDAHVLLWLASNRLLHSASHGVPKPRDASPQSSSLPPSPSPIYSLVFFSGFASTVPPHPPLKNALKSFGYVCWLSLSLSLPE